MSSVTSSRLIVPRWLYSARKMARPTATSAAAMAIAIAAYTQEAAAWGRAIGVGDASIEMTGRELSALSMRVTEQYLRAREYAI